MKKAFYAIKHNNGSLLKDCIGNGFDVYIDIVWLIHYISEKGYLDIIKSIVSLPNVDFSIYNNIAIRWASKRGHLEVVMFLASLPNVDASADDNYAIRWASAKNKIAIVKFLLTLDSVRNSLSPEDLLKFENLSK